MVYARGSKGTAGASRPRPSPEGRMALWTPVRGDQAGLEARLAEGEPGLQGSRLATGEARRGACKVPPIRHGTAVTPSPPGKGAGLRALGRGSPTVAPLRVTLRAPPQLREAASSCGDRRRLLLLLRPCTVAENRTVSDLSLHANRQAVARPTGPPPSAQRGRPTGAARPPADYKHNTLRRFKPPPRGSQ